MIFGIPIFLFSIPLILMILINNNIIKEIKTFITIPKLPIYRESEISILNIKNNLFVLFEILSFDGMLGIGEYLGYNAIPYFGTLYYISIPFTIIGIILSLKKGYNDIKNKNISIDLIFMFWFLSVIICILIIKEPNVNKANAIFIPLVYFISIGILWMYNKNNNMLLIICILYFISYGVFFRYYYFRYNIEHDKQVYFATHYLDALEYSKSLGKDKIYVYPNIASQEYIYVLLNNDINPDDFNTYRIKIKNDDIDTEYIFTMPNSFSDKYAYIVKEEQMLELKEKYSFDIKKFGNIYVINK